MKTIFTLLVATGLTTSAFAYDEGRLTVSFASPTNVQVVVDGRAYQQQDNTILLDNVQPGNHTVQIYRARRSGNMGRGRAQSADLLYSTTVQVRPSYHVDIMVNRFGKALIDERSLRNTGRWDDDPYGNGNTGINPAYNQAMSESSFNQFLQQIRGQWLNGKLNTAKEGLNRNYFNTYQVRQVLQLFNTESDKLELAKLAYRNTVDNRNYFQLYDVFSFQSTKDDLDRYIRDYRY